MSQVNRSTAVNELIRKYFKGNPMKVSSVYGSFVSLLCFRCFHVRFVDERWDKRVKPVGSLCVTHNSKLFNFFLFFVLSNEVFLWTLSKWCMVLSIVIACDYLTSEQNSSFVTTKLRKLSKINANVRLLRPDFFCEITTTAVIVRVHHTLFTNMKFFYCFWLPFCGIDLLYIWTIKIF